MFEVFWGNDHKLQGESGEPGADRTHDPRLKRALLYQLSYGLSGRSGALFRPVFRQTTHSKVTQSRFRRIPSEGFFGLSGDVELLINKIYKNYCKN